MKNVYSEAVPVPRSGLDGALDKFIGPGASRAEILVALIPAGLFGIFIGLLAVYKEAPWDLVTYVVACLLAFDMVGGIGTTATHAAVRWYHRPDRTEWHHLKFVVPHTLHIGLFAWLFVGDSRGFFAIFASLLLIGSIVILHSGYKIKRSAAHLLVFVAIIVGQGSFAIDPLMQWFIPALFIKLFASYLPAHVAETSRR